MPAFRDRGVHGRLDDSVAEVALQFAQPHQVREPRVCLHRPVPADHGRSRHHRTAGHRQLTGQRGTISSHDDPATANPQATSPEHDCPRRR
jgi:hypothetical protein